MAGLAMTRDDIIRMAREAGMERVIDIHKDGTRTIELPHPDLLERFAFLVAAAKEQEMLERIRHIIVQAEERGAAAEREACAKLAETEGSNPYATKHAAAAIRARKENT